jgi:hypothetical protein
VLQVAESQAMLEALQGWRGSKEGTQWQVKRQQLPVVQIREGLLTALTQHDVAVVGGDTGCGKTTQARVPSSPLVMDRMSGSFRSLISLLPEHDKRQCL